MSAVVETLEDWAYWVRYTADNLARRSLCRAFGHRPSTEVTWFSCEWVTMMDWVEGTTQTEARKWREIVRSCPRCGHLENRTRVYQP